MCLYVYVLGGGSFKVCSGMEYECIFLTVCMECKKLFVFLYRARGGGDRKGFK